MGEVHAHHQQTPQRLTNIPEEEEEEGRSGGGSANPSPTHTHTQPSGSCFAFQLRPFAAPLPFRRLIDGSASDVLESRGVSGTDLLVAGLLRRLTRAVTADDSST